MKYCFFIFAFVMTGCSDHAPVAGNSMSNEEVTVTSRVDTTLYIKADSITILDFKYSKKEFNKIIDNFPELYEDIPSDPEVSYYWSGINKSFIADGKKETISFGSEAGQDEYYVLYAYFLKKKNGDEKYQGLRDTLVNIYQKINEIFGTLVNGGTYFGHQYYRIYGDAEYSIYHYSYLQQSGDLRQSYDITKQKNLYLQSIRQFVIDEVSNDNDNGLSPKDKNEKIKRVLNMVTQLGGFINTRFYLQKSRDFQYSNY